MRILALLFAFLLGCWPAGAEKKGKYMSENTEQAAAKLAEFEQVKEALPLQLAAEQLMSVDLSKEKDAMKRLQLRRETLQLWLRLLATIDTNTDPSFNPEDKPSVRVLPPEFGPVDPRKQAEAVKQNEEKANRHRLQVNLRRMDQKFMPWAERFIRMAYTTVPGDQRELKESIQAIIRNPQRAAALEKAATPKQP